MKQIRSLVNLGNLIDEKESSCFRQLEVVDLLQDKEF